MHSNQHKVMPVIDKARRVIGIITWNDFFKFVGLNVYESILDKFRSFISELLVDAIVIKPRLKIIFFT
jgi:CBS domain-containing membrane protein